MDERRDKNLCFFCDERFTPGHKCKSKLYSIKVVQLEDPEDEKENFDDNSTLEGEEELQEEHGSAHISLNSIHGVNSYHTMRVIGQVRKLPLHILIDSGSTHNFLDIATLSKKLGCYIQQTLPLEVTVANGENLACSSMFKGFSWLLQGHEFHTYVMLVPLGVYEMVLGIQWLSTLGPVLWNFEELRMEFTIQGRRVVLRGTRKGTLQWLTGKQMQSTISKHTYTNSSPQMFALYLQPTLQSLTPKPTTTHTQHPTIDQLLGQYSDIFFEPKGLPPHRSHDHKIHLTENTPPIHIRPYRYRTLQKDAIELIIREMLESGVIRDSQSPFSSPIILVKKKDGSWRMCVDYRELNRHTVKDKFSIPVVEELMDELHGSAIFSKLDLRSGYWQIRMRPEDVPKTAFRTHEGHYEFLVMPFGLTNAPSTFQSLMNSVFKPYLRKFIMVFFDDILVYSSDLKTHLQHLQVTLNILRQHQLYARMSKCIFGSKEVEYLGHIISEQGVSIDPKKINAMVDWPTPGSVKVLRGFLGLTGYYRRFVKGYGQIRKPLTELFKKNAFSWSSMA